MSFTLLGILNAQAAGGAAAGVTSYDLLETEVLAASQNSITFSSVNTKYAADYQHLALRISARQDRAVTGFDLLVYRLNSDSGSNYDYHYINQNSSSWTGSRVSSQIYGVCGISIFSGDTADAFGANLVHISDPFNTSKNTIISTRMGAQAAGQVFQGFGTSQWRSTSAVSSIEIFGQSSTYDFLAETRISLYGLKVA